MSTTPGPTFASDAATILREDVVRRIEDRIPLYLEHPRLHEAMAFTSQSLRGMYHGNRLLNRIMNDRGRFVFGLFCLYLHATPDENGVGLTLTRVVDLCENTGVCSRGRAKAILTLMRWGGYVDAVPASHNRRQRPLVPTDRLVREQVGRWRATIGGLALMDPLASRILDHLNDKAVFSALMHNLGERYRAGFRAVDFAPHLHVLIERNAGAMLAFALINAGAADDTYPPSRPLVTPVAVLAREFDVSRAHVLKVLREAEQAGLISRVPGHHGSVLLLAPLKEGMARFFSALFALLADSIHDTLEQMDLMQNETPSPLSPAPARSRPGTGQSPVSTISSAIRSD